MVLSAVEGLSALSLGQTETLQSTATPSQSTSRLLLDRLPDVSIGSDIGPVTPINVNALLIKVSGDLDQLTEQEKVALTTAGRETQVLNLETMIFPTKHILALRKMFPKLEAITEGGRQYSWEAWFDQEFPRNGGFELSGLPRPSSWEDWFDRDPPTKYEVFESLPEPRGSALLSDDNFQFAFLIARMCWTCDEALVRDVKNAFLTSPFYAWYTSASEDEVQREKFRRRMDPLQHRLACLFLAKLLPCFSLEVEEYQGLCFIFERGNFKSIWPESKFGVGKDQILPMVQDLKGISEREVAEIVELLRQVEIPVSSTMTSRVCTAIVEITNKLPSLRFWSLTRKDHAHLMRVLTVPQPQSAQG